MKKIEVIDLLNKFNGVWYVYEPVLNKHGEETDQVCIAYHGSSPREKNAVMHRTVHDFTGCKGYGINIYVDCLDTKGGEE